MAMTSEDFRRRYGVPRAWAASLAPAAALVLLGFTTLLCFRATHTLADNLLTDEQGPVEMGTFLSFLAAGALAVRLAVAARRRGDGARVSRFYACFAAFCFFAAMEEISWGQSFFNIQTPLWLREINEQRETNVHDLAGLMELNSAFVLLFGIVGLVGVRLGTIPRWRRFGVPSPLAPLFALIAGMATLETVNDFVFLGYHAAPMIGVLSEAVELFGAMACVAYVGLNGVMIRREWAAEPLAPSAIEAPMGGPAAPLPGATAVPRDPEPQPAESRAA